MQTFKQFLADETMMNIDLFVKLISTAASKTPRPYMFCEYDDALHEGFITDARKYSDNTIGVEYKRWSDEEHTHIPATMVVHKDDLDRFYFGQYDGRKTLMCKKQVDEQRQIYAKKIEDAPKWSPSVAEHNYRLGPITFSARDGLGSTPGNSNIWHEGIVVLMKPSVFLELASDDEGTQEPTSLELEKLVEQGYALGIPFLSFVVDEEGNSLSRITGHEGRGRMRMIKRVLGDFPIPVHMFIRNGLRSNYIRDNPEVVAEIKQGLISQRGHVVRNPVKKVYVSEDGRNNEPGVEF